MMGQDPQLHPGFLVENMRKNEGLEAGEVVGHDDSPSGPELIRQVMNPHRNLETFQKLVKKEARQLEIPKVEGWQRRDCGWLRRRGGIFRFYFHGNAYSPPLGGVSSPPLLCFLRLRNSRTPHFAFIQLALRYSGQGPVSTSERGELIDKSEEMSDF